MKRLTKRELNLMHNALYSKVNALKRDYPHLKQLIEDMTKLRDKVGLAYLKKK